MDGDLNPVERLTRDLIIAARTLSDREARYLVDEYYIMQENRKRSDNQVRSLTAANEPNAVLAWSAKQSSIMEAQLVRALDAYTSMHRMGSWMRNIYGIGPIISAGLLAHINIEKAPTVGHIWRFAGLDPNVIWPSTADAEKWVKEEIKDDDPDWEMVYVTAAKHFGRNVDGLRRFASTDREGKPIKVTANTVAKALSRRPFNIQLKVICWKAGQSFMKFHSNDDCYYGKIYIARKAYEIERNDSGGNTKTAKEILETKNFGKTTDAYRHLTEGRLPPAQIDARSRRYSVKLFLSHLWEEWYKRHFGRTPPLPYPIQYLGHAHKIEPPQFKDAA